MPNRYEVSNPRATYPHKAFEVFTWDDGREALRPQPDRLPRKSWAPSWDVIADSESDAKARIAAVTGNRLPATLTATLLRAAEGEEAVEDTTSALPAACFYPGPR